jgi:hypothetical protein
MEAEHELYRTLLVDWEGRSYADCILTNQRLLIKWEYGSFHQYFLRNIKSVWIESMHRSLRRRFKGKCDPAVVVIVFANGDKTRLYSGEGQLVLQIQKALMPF